MQVKTKMMEMRTAGLLVIKNRKLLLAFSKNKQCYYLPGGKIDEGETAKSSLCREVKEELDVDLQENDLSYYTHISAPAYGEANGIIMEQDCFRITKNIEPHASAEIADLKYFSLSQYLQETNKAPGAIMVLQQLTDAGIIEE